MKNMAHYCDGGCYECGVVMPLVYDITDCPAPCDQFGVVCIDDVPVGTGRLNERGEIVDVEWDAVALAKLGLSPKEMR